jgi:hypothetical protein
MFSCTCFFVCCARCLLQVEEGLLFIALKMKSSKEAIDEEKAVRVAFHRRKASVPNHPATYAYLQEYFCINWNMERPPMTTVLPQEICLCLGQLIRTLVCGMLYLKGVGGCREMVYRPALAGS